jgi:hypothetical protein
MSLPASLVDVIGLIRHKGVKLWTQQGELRFRAPKGALTDEELARLRASAAQIAELLERAGDPGDESIPLAMRDPHERVPLAYSQLCHWRERQLDRRPGIRQIASATRLRGALDVDALRRSFREMLRRHEALRTSIVIVDGEPVQRVGGFAAFDIAVDDLSALPDGDRDHALQALIDQIILEPVAVDTGPMLRAQLVKLQPDEHALLVAMEHMVSDAYSMNVFTRDLLACYCQLRTGEQPSLPAVPIQFGDYAIWLRKNEARWLQRHGRYWEERLAGCGPLRFPPDPGCPAAQRGRGTIFLQLDKELKAELQQWCRVGRTTPVLAIFTAFVALVLRWCNVDEAVIRYQTDGRTVANIEHTVGFFAAVLNLRLELKAGDTFASLLQRVTQEYTSATENADLCFLDQRQTTPPPFANNSGFNWVSHESKTGVAQPDSDALRLAVEPIAFVHPLTRISERDNEPTVLLYEGEEEVTGGVYFPRSRFSEQTMQRFARCLMLFVRTMMAEPNSKVADLPLT